MYTKSGGKSTIQSKQVGTTVPYSVLLKLWCVCCLSRLCRHPKHFLQVNIYAIAPDEPVSLAFCVAHLEFPSLSPSQHTFAMPLLLMDDNIPSSWHCTRTKSQSPPYLWSVDSVIISASGVRTKHLKCTPLLSDRPWIKVALTTRLALINPD